MDSTNCRDWCRRQPIHIVKTKYVWIDVIRHSCKMTSLTFDLIPKRCRTTVLYKISVGRIFPRLIQSGEIGSTLLFQVHRWPTKAAKKAAGSASHHPPHPKEKVIQGQTNGQGIVNTGCVVNLFKKFLHSFYCPSDPSATGWTRSFSHRTDDGHIL